MKKVLIGLLAFLCIVFWGGMYYLSLRDHQDLQVRFGDVRTQIEQYEEKKVNLEEQYDKLEGEFADQIDRTASMQILVNDLDQKLYSVIYPKMNKYGYSGVIGLLEEHLPGDKDCITMEQYVEMLENGWDSCLVCENALDYDVWKEKMDKALESKGMECPSAVFFVNADLTVGTEKKAEKDFSVIIHQGETDRALVITESGDKVWYPGADFWTYSGIENDILDLVQYGGNLCFYMSIVNDWAPVYDEQVFISWMEFLSEYTESGELAVTDFNTARRYCREAENAEKQLAEEYDEKKAELMEQIQELEDKMNQVFETWNEE